jgi:polysaccharide export outer membrane protein
MKTMAIRELLTTILILLAVALSGSVSAEEPVAAAADPGEYRIGPEDTLHIVVWKNETLTQTVPVRPDGKISLPLVNDLPAAGLTPMQLRKILTQKLAAYISDPEVSVIVQDVRSFKVSVIGEVKEAGRYELKGPSTVLDVLAQAGGFSEFASPSRIVILRSEGDRMKRIPFNYNKVVSQRGEHPPEAENFYLQPGDVVVVP